MWKSTRVYSQGDEVFARMSVKKNGLIISFSMTADVDFLQYNLSPLLLFAHISDVQQMSGRCHEHSDEHNTSV